MKKIRLYIEEILVHICVALSIACISSVSYTHLDVYKRQQLRCKREYKRYFGHFEVQSLEE